MAASLRADSGLRARQVTAGAAHEQALAQVMAMRAAAFPQADGGAPPVDPLDAQAAQILISGPEGAPLASFRLMMMEGATDLPRAYAARFYDLAPLAGLAAPMAELGRFCVQPGIAPLLAVEAVRCAWGAITARMQAAGAGVLFGCSSFRGCAGRDHQAALALLTAHIGPAGLIPQRKAPEVVDYPPLDPQPNARRAGLAALPPLLRSYLSMGAWVGDHAVIDRDLGTLHVLTVLEAARIPKARSASLTALAGLVLSDR